MAGEENGRDADREILYGIHPVRQALASDPDRLHRLYLLRERKDSRINAIRKRARELGIPVTLQSKGVLDRLTGGAGHQGVVARLAAYAYATLDGVIEEMKGASAEPLLVVLDRIVDPHNLGAIARTAEATGVDALVIPSRGSAPPGGAAHKASAGALSRIPLCRVTNLARRLTDLKDHGFWVVGTSAGAGTPPWELDLTGPLIVVIGGEEKGIRPGVRAVCDMMAAVPLEGRTPSLNASVAAGMLLYEITRQRRAAAGRR